MNTDFFRKNGPVAKLFPAFAVGNATDIASRNIKLVSNVLVRGFSKGKKLFNFTHCLRCKLGKIAILASACKLWSQSKWMTFARNAASFLLSVHCIIKSCAKKQMVRINAGRIVAIMESAKTDGNGPVMENPRKPIAEYVSISGCANAYFAVALSIFSSGPKPAIVRVKLRDFTPKPLFDCGTEPLRKCRMLRELFRHNSSYVGLCLVPAAAFFRRLGRLNLSVGWGCAN